MINLKDIIENSMKYHYVKYNRHNKIIQLFSANSSHTMQIKKDERIVLVKLKTLTKKIYEQNKKSSFKTTGGPLYANITTYVLHDNVVTKEKPLLKNNVYFHKTYLKSMLSTHQTFSWMKKDIKKIATAYIMNRLNQKFIAINTITNLM